MFLYQLNLLSPSWNWSCHSKVLKKMLRFGPYSLWFCHSANCRPNRFWFSGVNIHRKRSSLQPPRVSLKNIFVSETSCEANWRSLERLWICAHSSAVTLLGRHFGRCRGKNIHFRGEQASTAVFGVFGTSFLKEKREPTELKDFSINKWIPWEFGRVLFLASWDTCYFK